MGNLVGAMTLSQRKVSDDTEPSIKQGRINSRINSRELNYQGKPDPIAMAISRALDDPDTSPLSMKNRKSFSESDL